MTSQQVSGVLLLLTFFAGAALAGDGAGEPGASGAVEFKSRAARDAAARYAATVERLNLDRQDKLAIARKVYATALTAAKDEATRSANLDEPARRRDPIAGLQKEAPAPAAPARTSGLAAARADLTKQLGGTIWDENGKQTRFNADGTATRPDSK